MKILVTGGTGFIGNHLVHRLARDGHHVVALVRNRDKARDLPAIEILEGDLSLFENPRTVLPACDAVIHLAGVVAADRLADYEKYNFTAVKHLVACLERQSWKPKRLLFASSLAAAGPSTTPMSEADTCAPIEPYGKSKLDAERFLQHAPFPTTSFRPSVVFGPGDQATVTLFKLANNRLGFRPAGLNPQLSYIDVDDLVDAIVAMLGDTSREHRTYFVSHPSSTDQRTLWRALGTTLGRDVFVVPVPKRLLYGLMKLGVSKQLDEKQYKQIVAPGFVCSSSALSRDTGWKPQYDLSAALAKAAAGFRRAQVL